MYSDKKLIEFREKYEQAVADLMRKHPNYFKPGLTAKTIAQNAEAQIGFHGIWAITLTPATKAVAKQLGIANSYTAWDAWFTEKTSQ